MGELRDIGYAAMLIHVVEQESWLGGIIISKINREHPRGLTTPKYLQALNSNDALRELIGYYVEHPEKVVRPPGHLMPAGQIIEAMRLLEKAEIHRQEER